MEKENISVLRESFDGLRRLEDDRRKNKKESADARVQAVVTMMEEDEAANERQAALVAIAANEKRWPLVANQV